MSAKSFFVGRKALKLSGIISLSNPPKFNHRFYHQSCFVLEKIVEVVPALGESITEGAIASWEKNVGDRVEVDDVVAIVETDKVTVDIKSTFAGVITKHLVEELVCVSLNLTC